MCNSVVYLACGLAKLNYSNVVYNDYIIERDMFCDMLEVDLSQFDILIATPPCNYFSKARGNKAPSNYAISTKHLLPDIIDKFIDTGKLFIVENVRNFPLFKKLGLFDKNCFIYTHGRHTYWTNVMINFSHIKQTYDFSYGDKKLIKYVQGGQNVNSVLDFFVEYVLLNYFKK